VQPTASSPAWFVAKQIKRIRRVAEGEQVTHLCCDRESLDRIPFGTETDNFNQLHWQGQRLGQHFIACIYIVRRLCGEQEVGQRDKFICKLHCFARV
jgi:hypothetical protein